MNNPQKLKPKLEELIPFYGFNKYLNRVEEENNKCYDLDGNIITEFPTDYIIPMLFYTLIYGGIVGGSIGILIAESVKYFIK